jgi:hypothetical protein
VPRRWGLANTLASKALERHYCIRATLARSKSPLLETDKKTSRVGPSRSHCPQLFRIFTARHYSLAQTPLLMHAREHTGTTGTIVESKRLEVGPTLRPPVGPNWDRYADARRYLNSRSAPLRALYRSKPKDRRQRATRFLSDWDH